MPFLFDRLGVYSSDKKEMEHVDNASISNLTPFCNMASNSNLPMIEQMNIPERKFLKNEEVL
jgi:hypothetical protein